MTGDKFQISGPLEVTSPSAAATVEPTVPAIMIGTLDATRFDANDAATVGLLWLF